MTTTLTARLATAKQQGGGLLSPLFHGLLFTPSLIMVALGQSSMAAGLTLYLVCLGAYLAAGCIAPSEIGHERFSVWRRAMFLVLLLSVVLLHAAWPMAKHATFEMGRFVSSYLVLAMMCIGALGFAKQIAAAPNVVVSRCVELALFLLVINAIVGLTGFKPFPHASSKAIGVFSEPSHLAMILAPLLAYACATESRHHRALLAFFFVWGVFIENLTTLVVVVLCFLITFRFSISRVAFIAVAAVGMLVVDIEYFVARLAISGDSDNLSVLVLLQGWETAMLMVEKTGGWGAGFQQFGFSNLTGEIADKISLFGEDNLNQFDGGSTAAKIVGEFGILGVFGLSIVGALIAKAFRQLRVAHRTGESGGRLLLSASLYTFVIELFARGVGYFSPTCFLALCALVSIACFSKPSKHSQ